MLSFFGTALFLLTLVLTTAQVLTRLLFPELTPRGMTTLLLSIGFFGSVNLFALGLIGEYIAKIFEEVKQRPHFIRRSIIKDGEVRTASDTPRARRGSRIRPAPRSGKGWLRRRCAVPHGRRAAEPPPPARNGAGCTPAMPG